MTQHPDRILTGLILDWGGVLTASLDAAMRRWADQDGIDYRHFQQVLADWTGGPLPDGATGPVASAEQAPDAGPAGRSPVHLLERGQLRPAQFELELSRALAERGSPVRPEGLLRRMLGGLARLEDDMVGLVRRARADGLRTALLSNSWGDHYPDELWDGLFDQVVISGRVGLRKPDAEIFLHTAALLGLPPRDCVMVDDLARNVRGAVAVGMVGVLHRDYRQTLAELEALFDRPLG